MIYHDKVQTSMEIMMVEGKKVNIYFYKPRLNICLSCFLKVETVQAITSISSLFHASTIHWEKKYFLASNLKFCWYSDNLWQLFSWRNLEESVKMSILMPIHLPIWSNACPFYSWMCSSMVHSQSDNTLLKLTIEVLPVFCCTSGLKTAIGCGAENCRWLMQAEWIEQIDSLLPCNMCK